MKVASLAYEAPVEIDAGPLMVVHSLPGEGQRLVVSFAGVGSQPSAPPPPEFIGSASANGSDHVLFISDPMRSWLNIEDLAERIVELVQRYMEKNGLTELVTLGNSMGGFVAIKLADLMPVNVAIAFAPQFSMHPEIVPEEYRWQKYVSGLQHWRFLDVGHMQAEGTAFFVFHGDRAAEAWHWLRFPSEKTIHHFILEGAGHNLASVLNKRRVLSRVVRAAMDNRPRVVRRTLQNSKLGQRFPVLRREDYQRTYPNVRIGALARETKVANLK